MRLCGANVAQMSTLSLKAHDARGVIVGLHFCISWCAEGGRADTPPLASPASLQPLPRLHLGVCVQFNFRAVQALILSQARLETYKRKVAKVESEKWLQEHRPILSVDVAGANRFISAAIPELTQKQKEALRVVTLSSSCNRFSFRITEWDVMTNRSFHSRRVVHILFSTNTVLSEDLLQLREG